MLLDLVPRQFMYAYENLASSQKLRDNYEDFVKNLDRVNNQILYEI